MKPALVRQSAAVALTLISLVTLTTPAASAIVFPWLCLERCNDTSIGGELQQLLINRTVFAQGGAAFELFNLGTNSTLVVNNLTNVAPIINAMGLPTIAMVSSYPYPPDFLYWMREVFANPAPFIAACIGQAKLYSLSGYNIDWEPSDGAGDPTPTHADALAYAAFLTTFSNAMHAEKLLVSVDVATWSPIWNLSAIGASSVDLVISMGTYTSGFPAWQAQLKDLLDAVPLPRAVVGLETTHTSDGEGMPARGSSRVLQATGVGGQAGRLLLGPNNAALCYAVMRIN